MCDKKIQIDHTEIREYINVHGGIKFSTLMRMYHLSSNEALAVISEYQKKGLLDKQGRDTKRKKEAGENKIWK